MNAGLTIRVRREPGCAIVTAAGEIDIATVAWLRQRLNTLAYSGRHVIADLEQVGFMDASGLGAIAGAPPRHFAKSLTRQPLNRHRAAARKRELTRSHGQLGALDAGPGV